MVGSDGALSKQDNTHRQGRKTVRTRHDREGGEKTSADVESLEKEIVVLREQLNHAAETMVLKEQQLIKLDNHYPELHRSERHLSQELASEEWADEETKVVLNELKLLMRELGIQLWRKGC